MGGVGLAEVDGAVLDGEDAVGGGARCYGEDTAIGAVGSRGVVGALVTIVRHHLERDTRHGQARAGEGVATGTEAEDTVRAYVSSRVRVAVEADGKGYADVGGAVVAVISRIGGGGDEGARGQREVVGSRANDV